MYGNGRRGSSLALEKRTRSPRGLSDPFSRVGPVERDGGDQGRAEPAWLDA